MPVVSHNLAYERISVDFAGATYTYEMPFLINAPKEPQPQVPQPEESQVPQPKKLYREVLAFDLEAAAKNAVMKKRSFCQL